MKNPDVFLLAKIVDREDKNHIRKAMKKKDRVKPLSKNQKVQGLEMYNKVK